MRRCIEALAADPRPGDAESLREAPDTYRVHLRDWRVVYRVDDEGCVITILRTGLKEGPEFCRDLPPA